MIFGQTPAAGIFTANDDMGGLQKILEAIQNEDDLGVHPVEFTIGFEESAIVFQRISVAASRLT